MKGNALLSKDRHRPGLHSRQAWPGLLPCLASRILIAATLLLPALQLPPKAHLPFVFVLVAYAILHLVSAYVQNKNPLGRITPFTQAALDIALATMIAVHADHLSGLALLSALALSVLSLTGRHWLTATLVATFIAVLLAVVSAAARKNPQEVLAFLPWLPLILLLGLRIRQQEDMQSLIPATEGSTNVNNRITLEYAARFFVPYQARNLTPLSLVVIRLVTREGLQKRSRHTLHRLAAQNLAAILDTRLRKCDIPARAANNTYAILLPDCTPDGARVVTAEIQKQFAHWAETQHIRASTVACIGPLPTSPVAMEHLLTRWDSIIDQRLSTNALPPNSSFFIPTETPDATPTTTIYNQRQIVEQK